MTMPEFYQNGRREYSYQPMPLYNDSVFSMQSAVQYKLDLNLYCIKKPKDTFFMHIHNPNLTSWGIEAGDVLVIERTRDIKQGDLVLIKEAENLYLYELFSVQVNSVHSTEWIFFPLDSTRSTLSVNTLDLLNIEGVITNTIHQMRTRRAA